MLQLDAILARPVFTVAGRTYRWEDVIEMARGRGEWAGIAVLAQRGAASAERAEREGLWMPDGSVEAASDSFRYQRGLVSADELEAWLAHWGLDVDLWWEWIRRSLWRLRRPEEPDTRAPESTWTWIEAVCSGALEKLALELADRVAVVESGDTAALDDAFENFCATVSTPTAVARVFEQRRVDWLLFDCCYIADANSDVVREAALCVREDRVSLAEVAVRAGVRLEETKWYLEMAPTELRHYLLSARPGDLLGPVRVGEQHWLIEVADKVLPSVDDPELARRAGALAVRQALDAAVSKHVNWHERL